MFSQKLLEREGGEGKVKDPLWKRSATEGTSNPKQIYKMILINVVDMWFEPCDNAISLIQYNICGGSCLLDILSHISALTHSVLALLIGAGCWTDL